MTIQYINTGTAPNQGNGDTLRTAFTKINNNFAQLADNDLNADLVGAVISDPTLQRGISVTYNTTTNKASFLVNIANQSTLGAVRIGSGIAVDQNGLISVTQSPTSDLISGTSSLNLSPNGALVLDQQGAYTGSQIPGTLFRIDTDQPNYTQMTLQNISTGTTATSDIMLVRNNGDVEAATGLLDIGINSSNYDDPLLFGVHTPGSAYMFTNDADLIIGTQNPGKRLVFHAGGSTLLDSAGYLDDYAWRFNRDVQVTFGTAGPLNFLVRNTQNNSASQAVFQAMNDLGNYVHFGINSSNAGAVYGNIGPGESFIHSHNTTSTMHIGSKGNLSFYSNQSIGFEGTPTLVMSRVDQSSTFAGHILPATDLTYDLGSSSKQWRSLWVGTSTIYIGGVPISVNTASNTLVVGTPTTGTTTATNLATESFVIDYVAQNAGGGAANTGDITFQGVKIIGAGTASGDGNGYSTLELVPDANLTSTNQYLIIDPTTPSHIHIRAGGTQDASNAELYLGGERNNVRINDYSGVRLNNNFLNSVTSREFVDTTDFTNATWWDSGEGTYFLQFSTSLQELQTVHDQFGGWPNNTVEIWDGSNLRTLTYAGYSSYLGNPNDRIIQVREAPPGGTTVNVQSMTFTRYILQQNYASLEYSGFEVAVNQDINLFSGQTMRLATGVGNIQITPNDANTSPSWYFTAQGYLQFPQGLGPTTSKGKEGDEAGSVVFDGSYIYYCTTDYTDGVSDIWKRVQWSNDTW